VKLGIKIVLILMLNLVLATPTSSIQMTEKMKLQTLQPKEYAAYQATKKYKWGKNQHKCLRALWGKESAWNFRAKSPTKDYGIPQRHMSHNTSTQIKDFLSHPHPQIDWGLKYISSRYGSPCAAWNFHRKNNWY
jgi:hypothetical protein